MLAVLVVEREAVHVADHAADDAVVEAHPVAPDVTDRLLHQEQTQPDVAARILEVGDFHLDVDLVVLLDRARRRC